MKRTLLAAVAATALASAGWADSVKIGFVTTLTTPAAVIGKDMENAVNLAVEHLGGKAGNLESRLSLAMINSPPMRANRPPTSW
jgi:branched-chain amino acid transport system substrate-binding protein